MAKISDVSKRAGVSTATVSRAFSNPEKVTQATLEKVMKAVDELNYRPNNLARNLRTARSYGVLVLVPGLTNSFFSRVLLGIERAARDSQYSILLGDTHDEDFLEERFFQIVETRGADGIIHLAPNPSRKQSDSLNAVPIVYACGCMKTPAPSVRIDNIGAARTVVSDLIAKGHRRIACIAGPKGNSHVDERLEGYHAALKQADIEFDPDLLLYGDFQMSSGVACAKQLLSLKNPPTALFCMNDEMAMGALMLAHSKKITVPDQVAITGFDDISYAAHTSPGITTIAQPAERMGEEAFKALLRVIEDPNAAPEEIVLPFKFIQRGSSDAF